MKQTSKEWLEDIGTTIAQPKPKKVVGWYCLSSKIMVNTIAFATHSKPNFIKRLPVLQLQQAKEIEKEQHRVTAQDFYYGSHSFKNLVSVSLVSLFNASSSLFASLVKSRLIAHLLRRFRCVV
jgi:hypothetical protein